jgi:16S rRNA (cytosine1402-N4)-methyltransferase
MTVVDATLGMAGHSLAFLEAVGPSGRVIGLDRDPAALAAVEAMLGPDRIELVHAGFADLAAVLAQRAPHGVDALFLDLGVSRDQLVSERFSFQGRGELDFRLDPGQGESAADVLARLGEEELADLLFTLGDERFSRRIARGIVEARAAAPVRSADQLVEIVRRAYPANARHGRMHVATRTFQALRLFVNHLLDDLERVLAEAPECLKPGGRWGVLTYHSGEAARTKFAFRDLVRGGGWERVTARAQKPSEAECRSNPGARSAQWRVIAKRDAAAASESQRSES